MDFMPAVRGKDKASDVPADGAEGISAVLPEVQAGEPDQREKFQNGDSKCQTLRRSADQRKWSCAALFCPERRKEARMKRIVYPRTMDTQTVYLQSVITKPNIEVGEYTMYHDFAHDPREFETNNVLYQYPVNGDKLRIGKFCSIACGAKFLFTSANHTLRSLSTYPFPIFFEQWGLDGKDIRSAWDNRGDIVIGNDVWIGYEAVILSGVTIGDGAIIGARAVVTKDVAPYTIVGGVPAKPIRRRFDDETVEKLEALRWWDWKEALIRRAIPAIQTGDLAALEALAEEQQQ